MAAKVQYCEEVFGRDSDTPLRCGNALGHKGCHAFCVPVEPAKPMATKEPTVEWPPREPTEAQLAAARNLRAAFLRCDNYEEEIACLWPALAAAEQAAYAQGLANRDERCLQSDMQRIREKLAAERAWDEGAEYATNQLPIDDPCTGGVVDRIHAVNPYRLPKGPTRNPSCTCTDESCGYCRGNG